VEEARTEGTGFAVENARATATAKGGAVKHGGPLSWFPDGDMSLVSTGHSGDLVRSAPSAAIPLGKLPRVTFTTTVIAARLIDREVVLWTRKMG
jgi:hypothetical protein